MEEVKRMDWSKAKTILIVTFLLLDLFLGYQVMYSYNRDRAGIRFRVEREWLYPGTGAQRPSGREHRKRMDAAVRSPPGSESRRRLSPGGP